MAAKTESLAMGTPQKAAAASSSSSVSSPFPPSVSRLWRPAAQRNMRNQWSKLATYKSEWLSSSSTARSHANSLVNAALSLKYMPAMELGVLSDMAEIRNKASSKLFKQQEIYQRKLLSSYKDMVGVVMNMINTSKLMRCYVKGSSSSSILQFTTSSEDSNDDTGDGAGIPVFTFLPVSSYETLAEELVQMYISELSLKRLLVVEFVALGSEGSQVSELIWSSELYPREFDDLSVCNLYSKEICEPMPPRLKEGENEIPAMKFKSHPNQEILQVYLTTWLAEVNVDTHRVDEIFSIIGEEMHVSLS